MNGIDPHQIVIDIAFFNHLIECLKRQREILSESSDIRTAWQNIIDMTVKQCESILQSKREEVARWSEPTIEDILIIDEDTFLSYNEDDEDDC